MELDPNIVFGGQWLLFCCAVLLLAWLTCYFLWVTVQLGTQWYSYLDRVRTLEQSKIRLDIEHHQKVRELELKTLVAAHEREIARQKAHNDAMNAAIAASPIVQPIG